MFIVIRKCEIKKESINYRDIFLNVFLLNITINLTFFFYFQEAHVWVPVPDLYFSQTVKLMTSGLEKEILPKKKCTTWQEPNLTPFSHYEIHSYSGKVLPIWPWENTLVMAHSGYRSIFPDGKKDAISVPVRGTILI